MYSKIKEYLELVKFEHSIFALPFVISGMILATGISQFNFTKLLIVIITMVSGRTAAMALNRLIDKDIDKLNPRTANRAMPKGRIKSVHAIILILVSMAVMIISIFKLPLICIQLLPIAIFLIVIYSYTKRFTILSHFILGLVLGSAATGGWLVVNECFTVPAIAWGVAVTLWVAGFDIIYSTQDIDFDKQYNLYSLPAKVGLSKAIYISRVCHLLSIILFVITGLYINIGLLYWVMTLFIAISLIYEQSLISDTDLSKVNVSFFNVNGYVSIGVLFFVILNHIANFS